MADKQDEATAKSLGETKSLSAVQSKRVKRWYYNGKGYATKNAAYRAWAYQLLLDEVLGEVEYKTEYDDYGHSWQLKLPRVKLRDLDYGTDEMQAHIQDLFAEKFPHGNTLDERCEGVCQIRYEPVWNGVYDTNDEFGEYVFASCKAAQKRWIDEELTDLAKSDPEATTAAVKSARKALNHRKDK